MVQSQKIHIAPKGLAIGARVWVDRMKDHGTVLSISADGRRAMILLGKVRVSLEVSGLGPGREPSKARSRSARSDGLRGSREFGITRPTRHSTVAREIDMHGLRVEDMLVRLDRFLNDALLARLDQVRIIHGHGSGALKKALHQRLKELGIPHFRVGEPGLTPGGTGVTIVSF